jgi:hypothetical protein
VGLLRLKALPLGLRAKRGLSHIDFKKQYSFELFSERREKKDSSTSRMAVSACPNRLAVADGLSLI